MFRVILAVVWLAVAVPATVVGFGYYATPLQERPFSAGHELFASSAMVGHGYGVLGTVMILVGVFFYGLRKRAPFLSRYGKLKHWLQAHIFLCTLGPYLILLHTTLRFGGLVAVSFWSMVLVVASGVFGRYVYVRIPKTIQGHFLSLEALESRREAAVARIGERVGLEEEIVRGLLNEFRPPTPKNAGHALVLAARWDLRRRSVGRDLKQTLGESPYDRKELIRMLREEGQREGQIALLQPFQRLFRYWHVFHLPLAILMFLILAVHVTVAVLFGYVWVFLRPAQGPSPSWCSCSTRDRHKLRSCPRGSCPPPIPNWRDWGIAPSAINSELQAQTLNDA